MKNLFLNEMVTFNADFNDMDITTTCNTCTRELVQKAYHKSIVFRFFREPLKWIMKAWVKILRIDLEPYRYKTESCAHCNRYYKNALKDHSPLFVKLNKRINPFFDRWMERIVGTCEVEKAREHARKATQEKVPDSDLEIENREKWIRI